MNGDALILLGLAMCLGLLSAIILIVMTHLTRIGQILERIALSQEKQATQQAQNTITRS